MYLHCPAHHANVCGIQVRKVHRESGQLELQELPPLVYQLLLLSTHGKRQAILVRKERERERERAID